ncbi:hypothetical protein BA190_09420 [Labrys sp. WJW]|uniref:phage head-tail joining protein n=1 Tax=Labrys sp. WJW TaxID=1737983 RepID=UPI0008303112|nr:hypothetical protein [Labrys sp. WJW]OCC05125.1 hypothetical protein BA190_09420 [Labrys sp. WJW]
METLEELQVELRKLRRAKRSGVLIIRHGDKSIQYRDMGELQSAIDDIRSAIADLMGTRRSRIRYHKTSKALG